MITGEKKSFGFVVSIRIEGNAGSIHVKLVTFEYTEMVALEYPIVGHQAVQGNGVGRW